MFRLLRPALLPVLQIPNNEQLIPFDHPQLPWYHENYGETRPSEDLDSPIRSLDSSPAIERLRKIVPQVAEPARVSGLDAIKSELTLNLLSWLRIQHRLDSNAASKVRYEVSDFLSLGSLGEPAGRRSSLVIEDLSRFSLLPNVLPVTKCGWGQRSLKVGWVGEVHSLDRNRTGAKAPAGYTTASDFCQLFKEGMRGLYALSLFLTADSEQAERSFVAGLDDCINGNPVFRNWAYAWSRRSIIMNAIRAVFSPGGANLPASTAFAPSDWNLVADGPLAAVIQLQPLERFVFVMSLLEGYSDHECSVLLNRSRREIVAARTLALEHLAELGFSVETPTGRKEVRAISAADL